MAKPLHKLTVLARHLGTVFRGKPEPPDLSWHWEVTYRPGPSRCIVTDVWRVTDDGQQVAAVSFTRDTEDQARDAAFQWISEQPRRG